MPCSKFLNEISCHPALSHQGVTHPFVQQIPSVIHSVIRYFKRERDNTFIYTLLEFFVIVSTLLIVIVVHL